MALVIIRNDQKTQAWIDAFRRYDPSIPVFDFHKPHPQKDVIMAAVWKHPVGSLNLYPSLKAIHSLGAGVDFILNDFERKPYLRVLRVKDTYLASDMAEYVLTQILSLLKGLPKYQNDKFKKTWDPQGYKRMAEVRVGIMGLGTLGLATSELLVKCGFNCLGWTRESKPEVSFPVFSGKSGLKAFLNQSQILVCLLPLTPETVGILNLKNLAELPQDAILINVARGDLVVEADLIEVLDKGLLSTAILDVFSQEPLPGNHPFWDNSGIQITPHIASVSNPDTVVPQIVQNYLALKMGEELINEINLKKGY